MNKSYVYVAIDQKRLLELMQILLIQFADGVTEIIRVDNKTNNY